MDGSLIVALIIIGLFVFFVVSIYFDDKEIILRELKKSRRKTINQIKENEYAKVIGKAKYVNEPLIAPLSGRKCVFYKVHIERNHDDGWDTVVKEIKTQDFFIENNSELAIVKAAFETDDFMRVHLVQDYKKKSGFLNDASVKLEDYLAKHNKSSTSFLGFNKTMRYHEGIIALDEKIAVKGIGKWKALNEPIEGFSYSRVLTLNGSEKEKLLITDEPKALERVERKI
jgi:K+ transporter